MRFTVQGRIIQGAGQAASFTELPWVREEFRERLGFDPYPGTLNLKVAKDEAQAIYRLAREAGILIPPGQEGFCEARCLRARLGSIQGAVLVPLVEDYYDDIVEVMAPLKIMDALGLANGQELALEVWD